MSGGHRSHHHSHHSHRHHSGHTSSDKKKKLTGLIFAAAVLMVLLVIIIVGKILDTGDGGGVFSSRSIREVNIGGVRCRPKTRIKTYLFMGVDSPGKVRQLEEDEFSGQCDALELLVIDQNEDTYTLLPINRNTVTKVKSLDEDGTVLAESDLQICLSHASGDGFEMSCQNTVDSVQNLLLGQPIDGYIALNVDSILVINEMLGGITVTIEDDFTQVTDQLPIGESVRLEGELARYYVQRRMDVGDGTNLGRMRRQAQFLENMKPVLMERCEENEQFAMDIYDALEEYRVTNLKGKDYSKMMKALLKNTELDAPVIEGETTIDEYDFERFEPDTDSLQNAVIDLFYERLT